MNGEPDTRPQFDVFLSHSSVDKPWVIKLKDDLLSYGVSVWLDRDEIRPGDLFGKALEQALNNSRAVVLIVSPEAITSGWVEEEYYRALALAKTRPTPVHIIPLILREAELPGFLQSRNWVDFRDETTYAQSLWRLVWGITGEKPAQVLDLSAPDVLVKSWPTPAPTGPRATSAEKQALTEDDLPFNLEEIPRAESFVGRTEKLDGYRSRLEKANLAVIRGMGGVGKTALGAELASQFVEAGWKAFWITLIPGVTDNADELIRRLAGFLAVEGGNDRLWKMLQAESAGEQRFSLVQKFELFLKIAGEGRYLLCLDDFHLVAGDKRFQPLFRLVIQHFSGRREAYPMKLMVIGRQVADYMSYLRDEYGELAGLNLEEAKAFLKHYQVQLDEDQLGLFRERVDGNAQILNLSIGRLRDIQGDTQKVDQFIANLQNEDPIQALMEDVSRFLSSEEQLVLSALSLFRGTAVGRPELEVVLDAEEEVEGLRDDLRNLIRWHVDRRPGIVTRFGERVCLRPPGCSPPATDARPGRALFRGGERVYRGLVPPLPNRAVRCRRCSSGRPHPIADQPGPSTGAAGAVGQTAGTSK
jgi:hypothetical protein